ncbi:MAG: hypothetical protein GXP54_02245 [Deltaproteobacteria bacterium]|nr:hypothetical protein [Deltaproteobacteria bacterium]
MFQKRFAVILTAVMAAAAMSVTAGCRKPAKLILTKDQRVRIQENILKKAPKPKNALNADFDDKIRLIGVDLSKDRIRAGETLTITYYWECLKPVPGEWKVFVHLELPEGKRMILDHNPMGELYPIRIWKKGEIIRDIQRVAVDATSKSGLATLWVGLFNEAVYREQGGGDRMKLKNADKVPNDGSNRVRAARFQVIGKGAKTSGSGPVLKALKAKGAFNLDGRLNEPDWNAAMPSPPFQSASGGKANPGETTAVMASYDDDNLYIAFHVDDKSIENPRKKRDDELWKGDAVEVYLDAGADGKDYLEIQVSPANVVFDALFKSHRNPDWKEAAAYTVDGMKTAVTVNGTLNKAGDEDSSYVVEMAIPFKSIPGLKGGFPKAGSTIRANFFRIEARDGKVASAQAFSPAGGDFHDLNKAGVLKFMGTAASLVRRAAPVKTATPATEKKGRVHVDPRILPRPVRPALNSKIGARSAKGVPGKTR